MSQKSTEEKAQSAGEMLIKAERHSGHRSRVRARVEREGVEGLHAHELLEYILYYASARGDMNPIAHELIDLFGSINGVFHASKKELEQVKGIGKALSKWIVQVGAVKDAYLALNGEDRPTVGSFLEVKGFAKRYMTGIDDDEVWHLCMGKSGKLLLSNRIAASAAWGEPATLREALAEVLSVNAFSVILVQVVRGRAVMPEAYDHEHTFAYAQTLKAVGVYLLDHVFYGEQTFYSMARQGELDGIARPGDGTELLMERYLM